MDSGENRSAPKSDNACLLARSYEEWRNPGVLVRADGFQLLDPKGRPSKASLTLKELRLRIVVWPESAWPCGRVIVVMEQPIRSGSDDDIVERNLEALKGMLRELHVAINPWPTA